MLDKTDVIFHCQTSDPCLHKPDRAGFNGSNGALGGKVVQICHFFGGDVLRQITAVLWFKTVVLRQKTGVLRSVYGLSTVSLGSDYFQFPQVWDPEYFENRPNKLPICLPCLWFVRDLSMICPWFVHGFVSMVCPWFVHDLSMVCQWFVHGFVSMICPGFVHDLSMVCPWFPDLSMI